MVESGVDACASDTRASEGDCVGRFSKVLKSSCHLAATDCQQIVQTINSRCKVNLNQCKFNVTA